jgi:hypothetical protein
VSRGSGPAYPVGIPAVNGTGGVPNAPPFLAAVRGPGGAIAARGGGGLRRTRVARLRFVAIYGMVGLTQNHASGLMTREIV